MRKINFTILIIITLMLSGCNQSELAKLKADNATLLQEKETLENEINNIKNGAEYTIIEIRKAYNAKDEAKTIELASTLHQKFPDSVQDKEAQGYVSAINERQEQAAEAKRIADEKAVAESAKSKQDKLREIIRIKKVYIYDTDSAGKVDVGISWVNNSVKTIKYVIFTVIPLNAVGDKVLDHSKYESEQRLNATGPFEKGQGTPSSRYWSGWYNSTITEIKLLKIEIEYMDGEKISINDNDVKYVIY